jgi:hypothetical protein
MLCPRNSADYLTPGPACPARSGAGSLLDEPAAGNPHGGVCEGGAPRGCHDGPTRARSWKRRIQPRKVYSAPSLPYSAAVPASGMTPPESIMALMRLCDAHKVEVTPPFVIDQQQDDAGVVSINSNICNRDGLPRWASRAAKSWSQIPTERFAGRSSNETAGNARIVDARLSSKFTAYAFAAHSELQDRYSKNKATEASLRFSRSSLVLMACLVMLL